MFNQNLSGEVIQALNNFGLTTYEAKAYVSLLQKHPAHGNEISRRSGVPGPKIYETLDRLLHKGMVMLVSNDPIMYEPLPYQEFLRIKKNEFEGTEKFLVDYMDKVSTPTDENILWQLKGHDILIQKVREIVDGAKNDLLASFWWAQSRHLVAHLEAAAQRGVRIITIQFGPEIINIGKVFKHILVDTVYERHGAELTLVVDGTTGIFMGQPEGQDWNGYWTNNPGIVKLITNYIRHDIYTNKLIHRFSSTIRNEYGESLEKLLDIELE